MPTPSKGIDIRILANETKTQEKIREKIKGFELNNTNEAKEFEDTELENTKITALKDTLLGKEITKEELGNLYHSLIKEFNLISIEDPFEEEDFESFTKLKEKENGLIVVGDDLTVTNKVLLQEAINKKSIGGMIIKPNQIGTLSETLETMRLARENDIELIVSHRSGETDDDFIADLAFAFGTFGLKSGSPVKSERMVKYQRLINISKI